MLHSMSRRVPHLLVAPRVSLIARHVTSAAAKDADTEEPHILFQSHLATRTYVLNRHAKRNALDAEMIRLIRSKVQEWELSDLCRVILGMGRGSAFCAGGDIVSVMEASKSDETRAAAISYFKDEFEMNHMLGNLETPYVAIMDGITMGGGAGLAVNSRFRVATENTAFAMPETRIGYIPDVGSNHFLTRLDGELGTYLALTATILKGRAVFEHGIATHYIPASRIPDLKVRLSSLELATPDLVDAAIEELYLERSGDEPPPPFIGKKRVALDAAFSGKTVEDIVSSLTAMAEEKDEIGQWAAATLDELNMRSPTSLKVALGAVRRGKSMSLGEVLQMEMGLATAFINGASPDFVTGVTKQFKEKDKTGSRPNWHPNTIAEVSDEKVFKDFFDAESPLTANAPLLSLANEIEPKKHRSFALPSEELIGQLVLGSHTTSGGKSLTQDELLAHLQRLWGDKHGLREKVLEIVSRRCKILQDPERHGCLQWVH